MIDRWWITVGDGGDALMVAAHYDAVRDLNARARQRMLDAEQLAGQEVRIGDREFAVGDQVLGLATTTAPACSTAPEAPSPPSTRSVDRSTSRSRTGRAGECRSPTPKPATSPTATP